MKRVWLTLALAVAGCDGGGGEMPVDAGLPDTGPPDAYLTPYCRTGELRETFSPDSHEASTTDVLEAGAAALDVTPTLMPGRDVWIGGYGNGRAATGVNDPQWARAIALRAGDTGIVMVAVETPIIFIDDVDRVREMVADLGIDYVSISSTHCHQCADNIGFWGPVLGESGRDDAYNAFLREQMAAAIREAWTELRPAHVQYVSFRLDDQPGGAYRWVSDSRDPVILDDTVTLARFVEAGDGTTTIATLIDWAAHAEYMGSENTLLSSDHPNWLRRGIEEGAIGPDGMMEPGVGGVAVFFQGAIGSQVGPNRLEAETWDGEMLPSHSIPTAEAVGTQVAWMSLRALAAGGGSVTDETARIGYRNFTFLLDVENRIFHVGITLGLFDRQPCGFDPDRPLIAGRNEPDAKSEVAVIDVGRLSILALPGELDPSEWVGGFDGSWTPAGRTIVDPMRENPPDLTMAPDGPYLRDLMRSDADYPVIFGLTNDYSGYFVPEWDYELARGTGAYLGEAPGSHYEETRSLSPEAWPEIRGYARSLLAWTPPAP